MNVAEEDGVYTALTQINPNNVQSLGLAWAFQTGQTASLKCSPLLVNGTLYITVPDAGSVLARVMGRRWWSVLPMHVQYFSRQSLSRLLEAHGFRVRAVHSHPKVFSVRYYLERIGGYSPALSRALVSAAAKTGRAERLVAPDFHDRVAVIATKG